METSLGRKKQQNRHSKMTEEIEALICTIACSNLTDSTSRWAMQAIADGVIHLEVVDYIIDSTVCEIIKNWTLYIPAAGLRMSS
jgi:endonuclease III